MLAEVCIIHTKLTFNVDINQLTSYIHVCIGSLACDKCWVRIATLQSLFLLVHRSIRLITRHQDVCKYVLRIYLCRSIIYASLMHPQLFSLYCLPFSLSALYWYVFEEYLHVSKLCVSLYWQILSSNILQGVYCSFFQCYFTSARLYTLELSAWMMSCCVEKEFSCWHPF